MRDRLRRNAEHIVEVLQRNGFKAYYAGGCVRDLIMGETPTDYDIVTDAQPEDIIGLFENTIPVGREFGVMIVVIDHKPFEVATFRKEGRYLDGRRPSTVEFTDEVEDAKRRDFTINGIFYDPIREEFLDYVNGEEDIRQGVIRAIGDPRERFQEDRLRILRGVRFAVRFRFTLERKTEQAIKEMAPLVAGVSAERVRDELVKVLLGPYPHEGIQRMHELGILRVILPEVSEMVGVEQPPEYHPEGDVFTHTLIMLEKMGESFVVDSIAKGEGEEIQEVDSHGDKSAPTALVMGILLHDVGKPRTFEKKDRIRFNNHTVVGAEMAQTIMKRLRFSRKESQMVVSLVLNHLKFIEVQNMRQSTLKRFLMMDGFPLHLELHRLDCLASHRDLSNYDFCRSKLEEMETISPPAPPLISGQDLIELGFEPGPLFREILTYIEDLQLEEKIHSREDAIQAVIEGYGKDKKKAT